MRSTGKRSYIPSGSDVEDLDTTLDGDDPVILDHRVSSLTGGDVTAVELHSRLVGDELVTEKRRDPIVSVTQQYGESTAGYKPHSPHASADRSCSDIIDYAQVQQIVGGPM